MGEEAVASPGRTVLVVEDDPAVRLVTVRALTLFGFATLQAADGMEGLEVFRANRAQIGCVLVDLTMPRLDGPATVKEMQQIDPNTRVILMTGYAEDDARERFEGLQVSAYLEKPFDLPRLRAAIESALDS